MISLDLFLRLFFFFFFLQSQIFFSMVFKLKQQIKQQQKFIQFQNYFALFCFYFISELFYLNFINLK